MLTPSDFASLPKPMFEPSQVAINLGAMTKVDMGVLCLLIARHVSGDSGDIKPDAKEASQKALKTGQGYISVFHVFGGPSIMVATDPSRTMTMATLLTETIPEVQAMALPAIGLGGDRGGASLH